MIIGIVIGSGIFFKTDDILRDTNGNVALGAVALVVGAIGIVFGGLSLSKLAAKSDNAGGLITYCEMVTNKFFAFICGYFQMVCYFPALIAIVSYVAANYTLILFPQWNLNIWMVTLFYLMMIFIMNFVSAKMAGHFQNTSTIIKMIPLFVIGCIGLFFGNPEAIQNDALSIPLMITSSSAIVSVAFSYDGWTIAPSICHEIKNAKRNLPLALCISPLIIMGIYLIYFIGMSSILGADHIIAVGDAHVSEVATMYFGSFGNKLIMTTIIISVLGSANGLTLGGIRIPYALALRKELPYAEKIAYVNTKFKMPSISVLILFIFTLLWLGVHALALNISLFSHIDISAIPIVIMYLFYTIIFISIIALYIRKQLTGFFRSVICSLLACLGSLVIIYGALNSSMSLTYITISFIILLSGVIIHLFKNKTLK